MKVVLVDDDEDDRLLFKEAIEEIRIRTKLSVFDNGQELMDYLKLPNIVIPHVIFLDLNMPVKNGIQCLKEIRSDKRFKDLIIAIYSTSSSDRDMEDTFMNGANIYINKPVSFDKLKEVVERVLQINWQYHTSNLNRETFLFKI